MNRTNIIIVKDGKYERWDSVLTPDGVIYEIYDGLKDNDLMEHINNSVWITQFGYTKKWNWAYSMILLHIDNKKVYVYDKFEDYEDKPMFPHESLVEIDLNINSIGGLIYG